MKVYAISDLHLPFSTNKPMEIFGRAWDNYLEKIKIDWKSKVNEEDIVLIAGDISWAMKIEDFQKDLEFFDDLPGTIVMIRGNHDYWWSSKTKIRSILPKNIKILQSDAIKLGNYIFCGTRSWDVSTKNGKDEDKKIYERELIRLELALKEAEKLKSNENDKIVTLLHYPPFLANNKNTDFTQMLEKYKVSIVVFGHIHSDFFGYKLHERINGIDYFLTSCDLMGNVLTQILP